MTGALGKVQQKQSDSVQRIRGEGMEGPNRGSTWGPGGFQPQVRRQTVVSGVLSFRSDVFNDCSPCYLCLLSL